MTLRHIAERLVNARMFFTHTAIYIYPLVFTQIPTGV